MSETIIDGNGSGDKAGVTTDNRIKVDAIISDEDGDRADIIPTDGHKGIVAIAPGHVSTKNSTTTPLASGGVFTGEWEDITNFGIIVITVKSDVASATDGLEVQFSCDQSSVVSSDVFSIPANTGKTFSFQAAAQYFRVKYTNGATNQSSICLSTVLKPYYVKPSSHRVADQVSDQDDAELTKSVITGEDPGGNFQNVSTTEDGNLTISDNSDGLAIAKGDVTGHTFVHKFGNAPDFDTGDGEITVWDGAEDDTDWENMVYNYSTTAAIDSISSSSAADTQDIVVQGLDANWELTTQTVTLNGQTRVALTTNLIRVFRAYNDNSTDLAGHVFVYENDTLTGGVPDDPELIRAIIDPSNQQTEMAVYTIPAGKTGYMRDWYMATSGGSKSSNYVFKLKSRNFGKIFRTKHTSALEALAPVPYQHKYEEPEVFQEKTDIEMTVESIASPAAAGNSVSAGFDIVLVDN